MKRSKTNPPEYQGIFIVSSSLLLLFCLLHLLRGQITGNNKNNSGEVPAASGVWIIPTPSSTKWWVRAVSGPSSTPLSSKASTKTAGDPADGCPTTPSSPLLPGMFSYVSLTPPMPNRIRAAAATTSSYLGQIQPGEGLRIVDGPACADGFSWWLVQSLGGGLRGWTVEGSGNEQWLIPCPNPAIACSQAFPEFTPGPTVPDPQAENAGREDECRSHTFVIGMSARVKQDDLLALRSEPYSGPVVGHAGPMSTVRIVNGPACAGGAVWWKMHLAAQDLTGWATEAGLQPCSKEDNCT